MLFARYYKRESMYSHMTCDSSYFFIFKIIIYFHNVNSVAVHTDMYTLYDEMCHESMELLIVFAMINSYAILLL